MKIFKNTIGNTKGFTLVETMIGLMILTIAIVSSTSLLISLISSNKLIVKNLQAYYLAQEGLEAVRNVRDTNWLHNFDWKKGHDQFLGSLDYDGDGSVAKQYAVNLASAGLLINPSPNADILSLPKTWTVEAANLYNVAIKLCNENTGGKYFANSCSSGTSTDTGFSRHVEISKPNYCLGETVEDTGLCENSIFVRSVVTFDKDKEVVLEEILTNWKGGAL
jgi:prepilin-type N-terminal cleavage/methylation domain-containing protein